MATRPERKTKARWQENETAWYEQTMSYCDTCGMLLPRKQLVVEEYGKSFRFCSTDCERLFEQIKNDKTSRK